MAKSRPIRSLNRTCTDRRFAGLQPAWNERPPRQCASWGVQNLRQPPAREGCGWKITNLNLGKITCDRFIMEVDR